MAAGHEVVQAGEARSGSIESLRAVAALGVLASHVSKWVPGGTSLPRSFADAGRLGVFLFFALTGYLLYAPFARRAFGDGGPIDLRRYARNRALRILPLYYVCLAVLLVVEHGGGSLEQWLRFGTFTESFSSDTVNTVNGPMWSLAVELQFYVLLPLLAIGVASVARGSRARAAAALCVLGGASLIAREAHAGFVHDLRWAYSLPITFFNFVPGMLLALARVDLERLRRHRLPPADAWIALGVACWLAYAIGQEARFDQLLAAIGSLLVLGGVVIPREHGVLGRALLWRPLVAIGVVSYSLYLWHYPIVISLARHTHLHLAGLLALATGVCLAVAFASYVLVERPFLRLRRRWGPTLARQPELAATRSA